MNGEAAAQVLDFVQQVGAYYGMDGYKNLMTNAVVAGTPAARPWPTATAAMSASSPITPPWRGHHDHPGLCGGGPQ